MRETNKKIKDEKIEKTMRIMANYLIDQFLEDRINHNLHKIINIPTIKNERTKI